MCHIARLVNEGFYTFGGNIRGVPVSIGGTNYMPPIPVESVVKYDIEKILSREDDIIGVAIDLCLYCMKTQIFNDGNKRATVIFVNHLLISKGEGLFVIPENKVSEFKKLLIYYYEDKDNGAITDFMKKCCFKNF